MLFVRCIAGITRWNLEGNFKELALRYRYNQQGRGKSILSAQRSMCEDLYTVEVFYTSSTQEGNPQSSMHIELRSPSTSQ
jgi:hypothetical protein